MGHKQFVSATHCADLQFPFEQIKPDGHSEFVVHVLLHSGTGEALGAGVGVGVLRVNVKLQTGSGVVSSAWGLLSGTLGATATCLSW